MITQDLRTVLGEAAQRQGQAVELNDDVLQLLVQGTTQPLAPSKTPRSRNAPRP